MRRYFADGRRAEVAVHERADAAALLFVLSPGLLAALALEHANDSTGIRVEHLHREGQPSATVIAGLGRIWLIAGKDFVFEIAVHCTALRLRESLSSNVHNCSAD
jgi:hypothetical protein